MKTLWPDTISKARALQELLRQKVKIIPLRRYPTHVAAVDAAFKCNTVVAVASLYTFPDMKHREDAVFSERVSFPYIPGYLAFREGRAILGALGKLKTPPGVILFDGQGIAHPRGMGIASHIGVILGIPAIGCAKTRLMGSFEEPGGGKGDWSYLYDGGKRVGAVVRTRAGVKPVFVSPGHLIDIPSAVKIVMKCVSRYRIPEPLREADLLSKRLARGRRE